MSQNIVVAVKAVDEVEIKTEMMAAVPLSLALSRAMSCKISLRRRPWVSSEETGRRGVWQQPTRG
jgi:hypothetical protein